jgi:hypothetical protein
MKNNINEEHFCSLMGFQMVFRNSGGWTLM